ncbi:MAG: PLxRFG domain-containing protein [Hyphomicrobiaceae bacterium]|nr:MAG: PLxRFG domain-containing protein [Hyphomicrobiaceae bacterium]
MPDNLNELLRGPADDGLIPNAKYRFPVQGVPSVYPAAPGPWGPVPETPAPEAQPGMVKAAFQRGAYSTGADFAYTGGMLAQMAQMDEVANGMYAKAKELEDAADKLPISYPGIENVQSASDLGGYAIERLVENVPMLASIALPGGIAGKLGAKTAAKLGEEAAAAAAKKWATAAAFASDLGLQTGESVGIAKKNGSDPTDIRVVGSGIGKAALDFVPFAVVAGRLGLGPFVDSTISKFLVDGGYLKRVAGTAATILATEVPTEVMQEGINIALQRSLSNYEGALTDDEKSQLINAAAGAASFALLAPIGGIYKPDHKPLERAPVTDTTTAPSGESVAIQPASEEVRSTIQGETSGQYEAWKSQQAMQDAFMAAYERGETPEVAPSRSTMFDASADMSAPGRWTMEGNRLKLDDGAAWIEPTQQGYAVIDSQERLQQVFPSLTDAKQFAQDVLAPVKGLIMLETDQYGARSSRPSQTGDPIDPISQALVWKGGPQTLTDQAVLSIARGRQQAVAKLPPAPKPTGGYIPMNIPATPPENPEENAQQLGVIAQFNPLIDEYANLLNDPKSYRSDGAIKNNVRVQMKNIEARAHRLTELTGSRNYLKDLIEEDIVDTVESWGSKPVEARIEEASKPPRTPTYGNLSEGEISEYKALQKADEIQGLDDSGYTRMAELESKAWSDKVMTKEEVRKAVDGILARRQVQDAPLENRGTGQSSMTVDQAADHLSKLIRAFKSGPQVMLVRSDDPHLLERYPSLQGKVNSNTKGFFRPEEGKRIWLFVDRHANAKDLQRSYLHEAIGHFGLRALLKPAEMKGLLEAIVRNPILARNAAQIKAMRLAGHTEVSEAVIDSLISQLDYRDAEEIFAFFAEQYDTFKDQKFAQYKGLVDRVIGWIRRALAKAGVKVELTQADVLAEIRGIRRYLSSGVTGNYRGDIFASVIKGDIFEIADVLSFRKGDPDKRLKDSAGNYSFYKVLAQYEGIKKAIAGLKTSPFTDSPDRDHLYDELNRLQKILGDTAPKGWLIWGTSVMSPDQVSAAAEQKAEQERINAGLGRSHKGKSEVFVKKDVFGGSLVPWQVIHASETRVQRVGSFATEAEANEAAANYKEALQKVIPPDRIWELIQEKKRQAREQDDSPLTRLTGDPEISKVVVHDVSSQGEVWGARMGAMFLSPMQMAEKYLPKTSQKYMQIVQAWWARKREITDTPTQRAVQWSNMGKALSDRFANALFDITTKSYENGRPVTAEEWDRIMKDRGLNGTAFTVRKTATVGNTPTGPITTHDFASQVFKDFSDVANMLEEGLIRSDIYRFLKGDEVKADALFQLWKTNKDEFFKQAIEIKGTSQLQLGASINKISKDIERLRNHNYFPLMRFGKYALTLRAAKDSTIDGKSYKKGEVVELMTFESHNARNEAIKDVNAVYKPSDVVAQTWILKDEQFSLAGMPPQMYDAIRDHVKLTDEQEAQLRDLYYKTSPGKAFLRHLTKRKAVKGWSQDALRVYASYMMNAANHVARIEYATRMQKSLQDISAEASSLANADTAKIASEYFDKHFSYLMNPGNDLASLRSMGFLFYLGFNAKSALVNLTQVPMVAHPFLAAQYGDTKALSAIARAMRIVFAARSGKGLRDKALADEIARGIKQGFLDESAATELAAFGEADVLKRFLPSTSGAKLLSDTAFYGSFLFRMAEKFNREVTFTAAWLLAKEHGVSVEGTEHNLSEAGLRARDAVQSAMFEYAKWNRPTFMRGKKSVFFLFWQYMQGLSYLAFGGRGGKTATRIWMMLLLGAGLQGLPFSEIVFDLFDMLGTQMKETLGMDNPRVAIREDLRELARQITDNPDMLMHGLASQYGLGPLHLLGVPNFDVSGSLSAGRPIPGFDTLAKEYRNPDEKFGKLMVDVMGPVMGIGYNFWKAASNSDPDNWKVWERAMPVVIQQASKALRRDERQAETVRGGAPLVNFDPTNLDHRLENIGQALGFTPSRIARAYELNSVEQDMKLYWTTRRALVIENYAFAAFAQDKDALADAKAALDRFNKQAPAPRLRITGDTIQRSMRERTRLRQLKAQGLPKELAFAPLYSELQDAYPIGAQSLQD